MEVIFPAEEGRGGKLAIAGIEDEIYLEESAGYLGLRLWIEEMGDVGLAGEIAGSWMRDGYVLFADGESSSALVWDVEFESTEAADRFERVALDRLAALAGSGSEVKLGGIVKSGDRFLRVARVDERKVRFINAATSGTASKNFTEP